MSCKFCGKVFNRGFNLRRHENEYCPLKSEEREMSETESQSSEDDASSVATNGSQSSMAGDSETDEEEADPWMPMVEEAMQKHKAAFQEMKMNLTQSGLDEKTAGETAYSNILPELQKELESIYLQRLQWIQQLKKNPVHKKIMQTKNALVNDDDFDPEEAMEAAVNKTFKRLHSLRTVMMMKKIINYINISLNLLNKILYTYPSLVLF